MAIKLFCHNCRNLIREIQPSEASSLTGKEICAECEQNARSYLTEIDKLYKKLASELNTKYSNAIVKLEELIHNAFK